MGCYKQRLKVGLHEFVAHGSRHSWFSFCMRYTPNGEVKSVADRRKFGSARNDGRRGEIIPRMYREEQVSSYQ